MTQMAGWTWIGPVFSQSVGLGTGPHVIERMNGPQTGQPLTQHE